MKNIRHSVLRDHREKREGKLLCVRSTAKIERIQPRHLQHKLSSKGAYFPPRLRRKRKKPLDANRMSKGFEAE